MLHAIPSPDAYLAEKSSLYVLVAAVPRDAEGSTRPDRSMVGKARVKLAWPRIAEAV